MTIASGTPPGVGAPCHSIVIGLSKLFEAELKIFKATSIPHRHNVEPSHLEGMPSTHFLTWFQTVEMMFMEGSIGLERRASHIRMDLEAAAIIKFFNSPKKHLIALAVPDQNEVNLLRPDSDQF